MIADDLFIKNLRVVLHFQLFEANTDLVSRLGISIPLRKPVAIFLIRDDRLFVLFRFHQVVAAGEMIVAGSAGGQQAWAYSLVRSVLRPVAVSFCELLLHSAAVPLIGGLFVLRL